MQRHTLLPVRWTMVVACLVAMLVSTISGQRSTLASSDQTDIPRQLQVRDRAHVSVIIDDFGNAMRGTNDMIALPVPIAVAVMPFLTTSKDDAIRAHRKGHEVLLHIPMEPFHGKPTWLGPGAITTQMTDEAIMKTVRAEIDSIPYVVGVNNHMGSKATADPRVVRAIVTVVKEKGLYVVDSATSPKSQFLKTAQKMGVPCIQRTVFLDDEHQIPRIQEQIRQLVEDAEHRGWGVGIGHVGTQGPNTYRAIRSMLTYLNNAGVQIVPVSQLIREVSKAETSDGGGD